tara:strand:- start:262 stop:1011 length:750 start_codon:yes stop_codon:yes gene_type:complete
MAKFLKIYCHGNPCSYKLNSYDWPEEAPVYQGNVGIDTKGVGSEGAGYHLINLDEVLSVKIGDLGGSSDNACFLELVMKGSPSPNEDDENANPKTIQFIFGFCDPTQGDFGTPNKLNLINKETVVLASKFDLGFEVPTSQVYKAHKQLIAAINSKPSGIVEWNPTDILGWYSNNQTENIEVEKALLLGYVYLNPGTEAPAQGPCVTQLVFLLAKGAVPSQFIEDANIIIAKNDEETACQLLAIIEGAEG